MTALLRALLDLIPRRQAFEACCPHHVHDGVEVDR